MTADNKAVDNYLDSLAAQPDTPPEQQADPAPSPAPEAPAEAAPTPALAEEPTSDPAPPSDDQGSAPPADGRPPRSVPIQALDEARGKAKDLSEQLAAERASKAKMEQTYQSLVQMAQAGQAPAETTPEPAVPAFDEDPAEHLRLKQQAMEQQLAQMNQQGQVQSAQSHAQASLVAHQQAFIKSTPDYPQALDHLRQVATQSNVLAGMSPTEAAAQAEQQLFFAGVNAMNAGKDPAGMVYEQAKLTGYQPQGGAPAQGGNAKAAADQLKAVQAGQQSNRSLSDGGGQAAGQPMSLEDLAALSDSEIMKNWDRVIGAGTSSFDLP